MQPDRTDKRILAVLERDARTSAAAIGRAIGLSRTAVQDRISRMETAGLLLGYRPVIAPDAVTGIRVVIFVQIAERPCDPALDWLSSLVGVTDVFSISGEIDAIVHAILASPEELTRLNDRIGANPMIGAAQSQMVLQSR
ncbi:Lrp/AsnC family transcriptional regulator [Aliisedimentitalea scapharcae]|uniref:Lrp/AsnC family transcriptional regulator n=1 Tax=Aliisedimentitalea scapharcae TaxID=1524259 RepID=A0ABZ2XVD3_9RHOB